MAEIATETDYSFDIWRKIPPEEKLNLMAQAQAAGVFAGIILMVICGTMAMGLKVPWIFWSGVLGIPFVFQFASAKRWRDVKPRTILEYLAARSAARRYAYSAQAKDLAVCMIFKGILGREFQTDQIEEKLEAQINHSDRVEVWVSLFRDTIVMMSERKGGAKLELAHTIDDRVTVQALGFDDSGIERSVVITIVTRDNRSISYKLESRYPAALLVFERKVRAFMAQFKEAQEKEKLAFSDVYAGNQSNLSEFDPLQSL